MSELKTKLNKEEVLKALGNIKQSNSKSDIVSDGIVSSIVVRGSSVGFALEVDINDAAEKEPLRKECEAAVKSIKGVDKVTAVLTSAQPGVLSSQKTYAKPLPNQQTGVTGNKSIAGVKNIILVASGKGGVGKSTVAVHLARSLAKQGNKVGIIDADIYGPSVPKMLGLQGKPEIDEKNRMIPKESDGIKSISIGYLVDEESAVVWRSSMALKAMNQLFRGVNWGQLDYLIVDTPPGTGDIQLSLAKNFDVTGAVLVSTPQDVALLDVKKAAAMFKKVNVPIFGIIENMSYFKDDSGKKNYIFGKNTVKNFAHESAITFLGEIPIRQDIREAADSGSCWETNSDINNIVLNFKKEMEKNNVV